MIKVGKYKKDIVKLLDEVGRKIKKLTSPKKKKDLSSKTKKIVPTDENLEDNNHS